MFKTKLEVDKHVDNSLKKINNETEKNLRCFSFAKLYLNVGAYEQASRYVTLYLSVKPRSAEGYHLLGKALEKLGKKESALEAYRKSLQLDPKQNNLVIKVCELLASDDVDMDKEGARYFCELAQSFDPHNSVVFSLKERLLSSNNDNPTDVSKLLLSELESRPTDINLRVRLLKHLLQHNKIREAFKHASDIENKDLAIFHNNITWYETFAEVLIRYQREMESSLTWEFWFLSVSVLDRLVALSLDDHIENIKGSSEYITFLFNFDQILTKASQNITNCPDRQLSLVFLNHFHAQLYFHVATCLYKQAKKDFLQFKEVSNMVLPVLLAAYHLQPPDLQGMWLNNCSEQRRRLVHRWHKQASFRCSQTGHVLLSVMKDRKSIVLEKASQYSTGIWREQVFKKLFVKRDQQQKINKSFFVNSPNQLEPVLKMPDSTDLLQYDEYAQLVYPDSLHHYIWIGINTNNLSQVVLKSFDGLAYSIKNLNNCAAESLNILDIQSFIYCATLCAKSKLEDNRNLIFYSNDKPAVLPACITEHLGTINQSKFLTAAYRMYKNDKSFNTGEVRLLLIKGIEVVRCVGQHGLDVKLLVKLAQIFDERSKQLAKQSEIEFNDARAEVYWKAALPILEKLKNNQAVTYSTHRLFEYKAKEYTMYEVCNYIEKGKLFTGIQLMKKKEHEKALHIFESLKDPYASYYQAEIYKHMADQKTHQNKENVTSEMRSQNIILLSKARDCLYLTLDRLREPSVDRSHPLNAQLGSEIDKIERMLSRIDPDCTNRNECDGMSDENVSTDSAGEHYMTTYNISHHTSFTPKHDIHNNHSTPYKMESRREARPSPERLDAQLRQLTVSKDLAMNNILEQNKIMVESHRTLLEELRSFKDAVNNLTATVEDLKSIRHGLDELKEVKHTVQELKHSVDDLQNVVDVVREMRKEISDLKKDSNKATQLSDEDLYVLDSDYDYALNANLGQYNPNLYQNYQGRLSGSAGLPGASYVPPTMYPGLYPAMAAAYAYGGAVLPQPGSLPYLQDQQLPGYPTQPGLPQQNPQVPNSNLGIGLLTGQSLTQNISPGNILVKDVPKATLSTFTSTTQAAFPSMSTITTKPVSITPISKAPPVNVVITSSDPLPINTTPVSQPTLSVIIPPQHIKGNVPKSQPHNYQIPLPTFAGTTITSTPSVLSKPAPVISTQSLLSNVAPPVFSAVTPSKSPAKDVSLGIQIEKTLDKTFSPNSSFNKSNASTTSIDEHDPCPDFKPIIPLPDEVPVSTGEEDEIVLFAEKAKLYRHSNKEWKERGVGLIKVLEHKDTGKTRILMRRDQVHKICANHCITKDINLTPMNDNDRAYVWVAHDYAEGEVAVETLCVKFKTADEAKRFYNAVEKAKKKLSDKPPAVLNLSKSESTPKTEETKSSVEGFTFGAKATETTKSATNVLGGFIFSSAPTFKPKEITPTVTPAPVSQDNVKPSPFSSFTFDSTPKSALNVKSDFKPVQSPLASTFSPVVSSTSNTLSTSASYNEDDKIEEFVPTAEFTPVVALPELVDVVTGEENAEVLFECKAKLFKFVTTDNTKEWKERGVGNIKVLKEDRIRLLMRREQVHKVCLNHQVLKDMKFQINEKNPKAVFWSAKDFSEGVLTPETFTARFKTEEQAADFVRTLQTAQASLNDQNVISSKHHKAEPTPKSPGFGDKFKPVKGTWTCKNCYVNNDAKQNHCVACETPKNDTIPKKTNDSEKSGPSFSFGITQPVENKTAPSFAFGQKSDFTIGDATNNKPSETQPVKGFGDAFKPSPSSWECNYCFVVNTADVKICIACGYARDGTAPKADSKGINLETSQKFSFGIPKTSETKGFGDMFKPKADSWECKSCLVRNNGDVQYCTACEGPKDDTIPKKDSNKGVNLETPGLSFSFGIPTSTATTTTPSSGSNFAFGDGKPTSQFSFGKTTTTNIFDTEKPTFSFSPSNLTTTQETKTTPISKFTFAPTTVTPKTDDKKPLDDKFVFGSTTEHRFEFTPRSPNRRISSGQGDEESDGSYVEEEEDTTYFKPVIPLPDKVEVKTGEEDEDVLYCQRAKLFRYTNSEWKERGLGDVKVLKGKSNGKLRILMRRETVMKICLNHILTKDIDYRKKDDKTWLFHAADYSEGEICHDQFCLRFKTPEIAAEFKKAVDDALNNLSTSSTKDSSQTAESDDDVIILDNPISSEQINEAKRLGLPFTFFQYKEKPDCNCDQCLKDDEYYKGTEFSSKKVDSSVFKLGDKSTQSATPSLFQTSSQKNIFTPPQINLKSSASTPSSTTFSFGTPTTTTSISFGSSSSIFPSFVQNSEKTPSSTESSLKNLLSTPSILGKSTGNIFTTPTTSSSNLFGGKSIFGGSATNTPTFGTVSATPVFGASSNTGTVFGGQPTTFSNINTNIFGQISNSSSATTFPTVSSSGSSIFGDKGLFGSAKTSTESQSTPVNLSTTQSSTIFGNNFPVSNTTQLKESDEVVLKCKSEISFASLAAGTSKDAVPAFGAKKDDSIQPFSFLGAGAPVFGDTTIKKMDKNKSQTEDAKEEEEKEEEQTPEEEYDPHYEPIVPMPDEIVVSTGEENEEIIFNERAKLYRYDAETKEWKERGVGQMKILFHPENRTYRLLLRRDQVHKVVLNQLMQADLEMQPLMTSDTAWMWAGHNYTDDGHQLEKLAVKFKNVDLAQKFKASIDTTICRIIEINNQKLSQIPLTVTNYVEVKPDDEEYGQSEDEYEDDDDDEEDDDDDDDNRSALYESLPDEVKFSCLNNDGTWQTERTGLVGIYYDNEICITRINFVAENGEILSSSIIGTNTLIDLNDKVCVWEAVERIDENHPVRKTLKLVFDNTESANDFHVAYLHAVSYAQEVGIKDDDDIN